MSFNFRNFYSDNSIVRMPFFKQLFLNNSEKLRAIIHKKPNSCKAQTACSRELPHPKFLPTSKILESIKKSFSSINFLSDSPFEFRLK